MNPHAPQVRIDGRGLVTGLALSSMLGGQLETIAEDHGTIRHRSGSPLTYRCGMRGLDASVDRWRGLLNSCRDPTQENTPDDYFLIVRHKRAKTRKCITVHTNHKRVR
jgi:hypothetical protein